MSTIDLSSVKRISSDEAFAVFEKALANSEGLLGQIRPIVRRNLDEASLDPSKICIATVGSTARREALSASDVDLLPIWCGDQKEFPHFEDLTEKVREDIKQATKLDVSTSRNLMRSTELNTLCKADGIGGDDDRRRTLTQRMLVLTESEQLGGDCLISDIRRSILEAYVGQRDDDRTVSKHPMTVCNDIARYYRTLCVDYKSRAETKPESWAERHAKLRNPRKIWCFSTVMAIARKVIDIDEDSPSELFDSLAETFDQPPILRLASAAESNNEIYVKNILDIFSKYIDKMGETAFRDSLGDVDFENRKSQHLVNGKENPYFELHERSRKLSVEMLSMLRDASPEVKDKVFQWFLL